MEPLMEITMGDMLDETARKFPNNDAVVYTDRDYRRTYAEFAAETDLVARGLMAMGIKRGDKVAIWATNHQQWLINMYATAKIGAIMVTVNTSSLSSGREPGKTFAGNSLGAYWNIRRCGVCNCISRE